MAKNTQAAPEKKPEMAKIWPGVPAGMEKDSRFCAFDPNAGVWLFVSVKRRLEMIDPRWKPSTDKDVQRRAPKTMIHFDFHGLKTRDVELGEAMYREFNAATLNGKAPQYRPTASAGDFAAPQPVIQEGTVSVVTAKGAKPAVPATPAPTSPTDARAPAPPAR